MLQLPKFPIKCQTKDGKSFLALFKPTGNPKEIKIIVRAKSGLPATTLHAPAPKDEVLSWGRIALDAFENSQQKEDAPNAEAPKVPLQSSLPVKKSDSKTKPSAPVLSGVRSHSDGVIFVKDATPDVLYLTVQSSDPQKQYMCRLNGKSLSGEHVLHVYYPTLRQWQDVPVNGTYLLKPYPKERQMSTAQTPTAPKATAVPSAKTAPNAPQARSKSGGLTVYEAWGRAFAAHGTKPNAPELIVKFMEEEYPNRKTAWAKWVNPVRARYNAGKLPGVSAPDNKIAVYRFDTHAPVPTRTGEDRRQEERRTPPLKAVRRKTGPAVAPEPKAKVKAKATVKKVVTAAPKKKPTKK